MATDLSVELSGSLKPSFKSLCFGLAEGVVCCSLEERSHPDWKWPFTGLPLIGDFISVCYWGNNCFV